MGIVRKIKEFAMKGNPMEKNLIRLLFSVIIFVSFAISATVNLTADDFDHEMEKMTWNQIKETAKGQTVNFYMWGGSKSINRYVTEYLGIRLKKEYQVTLNMVPVKEIKQAINQIRDERKQGRVTNGTIDLIWINGENFYLLKKGRMLFRFSAKLPNMKFVDHSNLTISHDFGYAVDGYEAPYGSAQFTLAYESSKVRRPPKSVAELKQWIKSHPGKFTYPKLPQFIGSAFVRQIFYHVAGGHQNIKGPFDESTYERYAPKLWDFLNEIKPYLWKKGKQYPASIKELEELYSQGEVYFSMDYTPYRIANLVLSGQFSETTRSFVFEEGTISNTNYVAIPFNAKAKAGAMVLANLILDPAAQFEKMRPEVWGSATVLWSEKLSNRWNDRFKKLTEHPSVIDSQTLARHQVPELQPSWLLRIEDDWKIFVLRN